MSITPIKTKAQLELEFLEKERDEAYTKLKSVRSSFELEKINSIIAYIVWRYEQLGY